MVESGYEINQMDIHSSEEQCNIDDLSNSYSQEIADFPNLVAFENNLPTDSKMPEAKMLFFKMIEDIESL